MRIKDNDIEVLLNGMSLDAVANGIKFEYNIGKICTCRIKHEDVLKLISTLVENALASACEVTLSPYVKLNVAGNSDITIITLGYSKLPSKNPVYYGRVSEDDGKKVCADETDLISEIVYSSGGDIKIDDIGDSAWVVVKL